MVKRFVRAFVVFVGLIVPGALAMALLAAPPAKPAPFRPQGCLHNLETADARIAAYETRMRKPAGGDAANLCRETRLYFLEIVKARAVTALCAQEPERARTLGRLDASVAQLNRRIAVACN